MTTVTTAATTTTTTTTAITAAAAAAAPMLASTLYTSSGPSSTGRPTRLPDKEIDNGRRAEMAARGGRIGVG
ncbi:hypothetical protein LTR28_007505, partial [Elasticomyces elasticus]